MHSFRSLLDLAERTGQLRRISREVDPRFELPGVMSLVEAGGCAYRFDHVRGSPFPVVGGLLNTMARIGAALQDTAGADFGHTHLDGALERAKSAPVPPVIADSGPVQEVVVAGPDVDLGVLPVPRFFERDTGHFLTAAVGVSRHPVTGALNFGIYRTLVLDHKRIVVSASALSDLRGIYQAWESLGAPMPIALAIGVAPALLLAAASKLAPGESEAGVAGALQGRPLELVRCRTNDLLVPAQAEFVIEGRVDFSTRVTDVHGEFAGQYGEERSPVTTVHAITHREKPLFHVILAGRNPEHNNVGGVAAYGIKRGVEAALREAVPELQRVHVFLDPALGTLAHVAATMDKRRDAETKDLIARAFAAGGGIFPVRKIVKRIVVVDDDIDVSQLADVEWAIWTRVASADQFMVLPDVETVEFERAALPGPRSVRIGIDATKRLAHADRLARPVIPGAALLDLREYL